MFSLSIIFWNVKEGVQWIFSGVYDPNDDCSERILWDELAGI